MPVIPAFCDRCGTAFGSGIFVENCLSVNMSGNKSGPCPKCGSMGTILEGIFNISKDAITILSAPLWTFEKLRQLSSILKESKDKKYSHDQVVERVNEETPELNGLVSALPRTRIELYAFLTMLLVIVTIVMSQYSSEAPTQSQNQNVLDQAIENLLTYEV